MEMRVDIFRQSFHSKNDFARQHWVNANVLKPPKTQPFLEAGNDLAENLEDN